jgi:hypothetical protein
MRGSLRQLTRRTVWWQMPRLLLRGNGHFNPPAFMAGQSPLNM